MKEFLKQLNEFADLFNKKKFWEFIMSAITILWAFITDSFDVLSNCLNNTVAGDFIIIITFVGLLFKINQFLIEGLLFFKSHICKLISSNKASILPGGHGGNATVIGSNSKARGGNGGNHGIGLGGNGGNAMAQGDNCVAVGGNGGNGGQMDGRGGLRTLSSGEINNLHTDTWKYGYGGAGGNTQEYNRKLKLLTQIRTDYIQSFPCDEIFINAGIDQVPKRWINKRLEELNESWRVEMSDGGYLIKL